MTVVRVAVVHQHTNNFGDDAAGVALVEEISRTLDPEAIDVHYVWHKDGRRLSTSARTVRHHMAPTLSGLTDRRRRLALAAASWPLSRRTVPDLAEMVDRCRAADLVFVAPAGANLGIYKDWMYLLTLVVLVRSGIRLRFFQNTIGPSGSRTFDQVATWVLRRSEVSVREEASARWLTTVGVHAYVGVDTALLLEPRPRPRVGAPYVALVPTRLASWHPDFRDFDDREFLGSVLPDAVAAAAVRRDLDVVIVPHLSGPEAEADQHRFVVEALARRGCRARLADVASLADYRDALAGARAVVSMRYHGLVVAGIGGVPCVALSYENKMRESAAYLGLAELEVEVRDAYAPLIRDRLERALDDAQAIGSSVLARVAALRPVAEGPMRAAESAVVRR